MIFNNLQRLVFLIVLILQPWFYQLIHLSLPLTILLIIVTLLLTFKSKLTFFLLIILTLGIAFYQLRAHFDKELFVMTEHDVILINRQINAFPNQTGRFFANKPLFFWQKIERNLFFTFDPNIYFFSGHPRERLGIVEQPRFGEIFLPFLMLGIYILCQRRAKWIFGYGLLVVLISTFITPAAPEGSILLFPFYSLVISLGVYQALQFIRLKLKL